MTIQHLRSSTANKRPTPAAMSDGQIAVNTNTASPGLFFKDSAGALIKVGPVHVGTTAPNASPASGGATGNTVGEQWLDTTGGTYVFKVWDGSAWRSETGTFVDVNGDVMTGALGIIAGSAGSPGLYFSGDTNTGLYSPGSDQLALATGGTGRLFVDASGNIKVSTGEIFQTSASSYIRLDGGTGSGTGANVIVFGESHGSTPGRIALTAVGTGAITASTAGTERLRITSAGLVGVGTSSPSNTAGFSQQLQLSGNLPCISIDNTGTGANKYSLGVNGAGAFGIWDNTVSAFRMYINSSGSVGIGTTAINTTLEVLNSSTPIIRVGDGTRHVQLWGGSSTQNQAVGTATSAAFNININSSPVATFDTSGRLLVGTSSDSGGALLQVNGDRIRVGTAKTPASATATGTAGEICWDASYVYVCTAANTWKRSALSTW